MKIKHLHEISNPKIRKRDNELITHHLNIMLSTNEALAVSELFEQQINNKPTYSLIRAFLIQQAIQNIDEKRLAEIMAIFKIKEQLVNPILGEVLEFLKTKNNKKSEIKETVVQSSGNKIIRRRKTSE